MKNAENMEFQAGELDKWLRFASCHHLGYIATGMGIDDSGSLDLCLIVYWDKTCSVPGGMPDSFGNHPIKLKRIGRPIPANH